LIRHAMICNDIGVRAAAAGRGLLFCRLKANGTNFGGTGSSVF
jgi:hypothetical protein